MAGRGTVGLRPAVGGGYRSGCWWDLRDPRRPGILTPVPKTDLTCRRLAHRRRGALAGATCLWPNRVGSSPVATFRRVALAALLLSLIPDAAIWLTAHYPQTRAATVLPLMAMHILVATVCLTTLPRLGKGQPGI